MDFQVDDQVEFEFLPETDEPRWSGVLDLRRANDRITTARGLVKEINGNSVLVRYTDAEGIDRGWWFSPEHLTKIGTCESKLQSECQCSSQQLLWTGHLPSCPCRKPTRLTYAPALIHPDDRY